MESRILTFRNLDSVDFEVCEVSSGEEEVFVFTDYSTISPGTELFCIAEAAKSAQPVQPGYILVGHTNDGKRYFLFPSLEKSSACHCSMRSVSPDSLLVPLPDEIRGEEAGFLRFINIGLHSLNLCSRFPERVCVIGLGPVGNLAAQSAGIMGCDVTGVDPSSRRRKVAEKCGIAKVVCPEDLSDLDRQFDFVIDTVASSSTINASANILRTGGECSLVGIVKDGELKAADIFKTIWQRDLVFRSGWEMLSPVKSAEQNCRISTEQNILRAINWMKSGFYQLSPLITGIIPAELDAIQKAYRLLKDNPDENMCFVINW